MKTLTSPSPLKPLRAGKPAAELSELSPLGMDAEALALDIRRYFGNFLGRDKYCRSSHYPYQALVLALRDRLMERWKNTRYAYEEAGAKHAYYLSLEFLMGRTLGNALLNLGLDESTSVVLRRLGLDLEELIDVEHDAGLGNGGLGRLAACFLDSCATLQLPVMGYGIRYEYGMFRQRVENARQVEEPDHWLRDGNPWELERPEHTRRIHYGGRTDYYKDAKGRQHARWVDSKDVLAVPFDTPIPGYRNGTVNVLRLWSAAATDEFDLGEFNAGSYTESVAAKNAAENITMVLYPNDASENGKELRLRQQYFLASASLQDVLERWELHHGNDFGQFAEKNCFQLNDTHPTCAVPELMRLLVDEHGLDWDQAWQITSRTMAYTNHTLLPEALERWSVRLFGQLLPRLMDIIYEINARFLKEVARRWPGDTARLARMSLIEEGPEPQVRMAYLAIVGSFSVNGVAELHSDLLQQGLFRDFFELWPHKFNNKTNGVTQRRWLAAANPGLNPDTGDVLWTCTGNTVEVIPTPAVGHGLLFVTSGRAGPTLAVRPGGTGDVTATHVAWSTPKGSPFVPSPLVFGEYLYTINDMASIASTFNAKTGELITQARLGEPQKEGFSASPLAVGGKVFFTNDEGDTFVLSPAPDFKLLHVNRIGEQTLASPALVDGRWYIRTASHLWAIGTPPR